MDKKRLKNWYGSFIRAWACGQNNVYGRFSSILSICLLASTYLELKHVPLYWWQFCLLGLAIFCAIWVSGFLYVYFGLYKLEQGAAQRHNPEMMEIKADVKKCLELLGENK
jgi:hypothetical protein